CGGHLRPRGAFWYSPKAMPAKYQPRAWSDGPYRETDCAKKCAGRTFWRKLLLGSLDGLDSSAACGDLLEDPVRPPSCIEVVEQGLRFVEVEVADTSLIAEADL